jgi:hypothetical protein
MTGRKLGNPTNFAQAAAKGRQISVEGADRSAETIIPTIESIRRCGITSLRGVATALNNRGVRAARGGQWQASSVRNVLARAQWMSFDKQEK